MSYVPNFQSQAYGVFVRRMRIAQNSVFFDFTKMTQLVCEIMKGEGLEFPPTKDMLTEGCTEQMWFVYGFESSRSPLRFNIYIVTIIKPRKCTKVELKLLAQFLTRDARSQILGSSTLR